VTSFTLFSGEYDSRRLDSKNRNHLSLIGLENKMQLRTTYVTDNSCNTIAILVIVDIVDTFDVCLLAINQVYCTEPCHTHTIPAM